MPDPILILLVVYPGFHVVIEQGGPNGSYEAVVVACVDVVDISDMSGLRIGSLGHDSIRATVMCRLDSVSGTSKLGEGKADMKG